MFELTPFVRRHNVSSYDPFREMENFEKNFCGKSQLPDFKTDIKDNGDSYELMADLPGFKKEDINVSIDGGYMTISAERHNETEEKDKRNNYVRIERSYGNFSRSFDISGIKADAISASYEDGVLKLTMPKLEKEVPSTRRLEIK